MDSVLLSIKKLLGLTEDYDVFDTDLILHINTAFMILCQLGVGPDKPFRIEGDSETWDDFSENFEDLGAVVDYVYLKVKLLFDSSTLSGPVIEQYNNQLSELEWRLNVASSEI